MAKSGKGVETQHAVATTITTMTTIIHTDMNITTTKEERTWKQKQVEAVVNTSMNINTHTALLSTNMTMDIATKKMAMHTHTITDIAMIMATNISTTTSPNRT